MSTRSSRSRSSSSSTRSNRPTLTFGDVYDGNRRLPLSEVDNLKSDSPTSRYYKKTVFPNAEHGLPEYKYWRGNYWQSPKEHKAAIESFKAELMAGKSITITRNENGKFNACTATACVMLTAAALFAAVKFASGGKTKKRNAILRKTKKRIFR